MERSRNNDESERAKENREGLGSEEMKRKILRNKWKLKDKKVWIKEDLRKERRFRRCRVREGFEEGKKDKTDSAERGGIE
ncbi:hypothetical protein ALC53_03740 [Atta colombica]|uniref:Uncharacterized protein n=1 Tax=Atta colombica TaxID=520822 RepID=A0A151I5H7_9HYME|nr:hypothetical protein ALC53_03740 [Atta colombica]